METKHIHFLKKLIIPSEEEEAPMNIYWNYKDNKHLNAYGPSKTLETQGLTYPNSFPVMASYLELNTLLSIQPQTKKLWLVWLLGKDLFSKLYYQKSPQAPWALAILHQGQTDQMEALKTKGTCSRTFNVISQIGMCSTGCQFLSQTWHTKGFAHPSK